MNDFINVLQLFSIGIEFLIVILGLHLGFSKKKCYGFGFALTFALYVFYDFVDLFGLPVSELVLKLAFFIATVSALFALICASNQERRCPAKAEPRAVAVRAPRKQGARKPAARKAKATRRR